MIIAKLTAQKQGVIALGVGAAYVFGPPAFVHAGIGPVIHFAEGIDFQVKRIAGKTEMIRSVSNQLVLNGAAILLPLALQIGFAFALQAWIERAGG